MDEHRLMIHRREFLAKSALAVGTLALCGCSTAQGRGVTAGDDEERDYYISRKGKLLAGFEDLSTHASPVLASSYGDEFAQAVDADARGEFEALIPELPYVGGDRNELTENLVQSAMALALYRAMKQHDRTVEETGAVLYRTVEAMVNSYPRVLTRTIGFYQMSGFGQRKRRRAALESQKRLYPSDWVFSFVEGDGEDFDWGVDYSECGIVKLMQAQGAAEFTPYLCLTDFPVSEAFGYGLVRTMTLAEGGEKCDFRFKWGRETQKVSQPGILAETPV
jgi:hypothetical protein